MPKAAKKKLKNLKTALKIDPNETKEMIIKTIKERKKKIKQFKEATKMLTMVNIMNRSSVEKSKLEKKCKDLESKNIKLSAELERVKIKMASFNSLTSKVKRKNRRKSKCSSPSVTKTKSNFSPSNSIISRQSSRKRRRKLFKNRTNTKSPLILSSKSLVRRSTNLSILKAGVSQPKKRRKSFLKSPNTPKDTQNKKWAGSNKKDHQKCYAYVKRARHKQMTKKKGIHIFSQKYTLKMITNVYKETQALEDSLLTVIDFPIFVYYQFLMEFGNHKKTGKKFYKFLVSLRYYHSILRVSIFCKFMKLYEFANYSSSDVKVRLFNLTIGLCKRVTKTRTVQFNWF